MLVNVSIEVEVCFRLVVCNQSQWNRYYVSIFAFVLHLHHFLEVIKIKCINFPLQITNTDVYRKK